MGDAAIWYPVESDEGILRKISVGARLSHLFVHPMRDVDIAQAMGGRLDEQQYRCVTRAVVEIGPFSSYSLRNELLALENHLDRGGSCIVAEDEDRAFAAFVSPPARGVLQLFALSQPWQEIHGTPSSQCVLSGPSPEGLEERLSMNVWSATGTALMASAVRHDWTPRAWCLLRTEGFLPEMRRAKEERNTAAISHEHRRAFSFRITLDMDVEAIDALASAPGVVLQGTEDTGATPHRTPDGALDTDMGGTADRFITIDRTLIL